MAVEIISFFDDITSTLECSGPSIFLRLIPDNYLKKLYGLNGGRSARFSAEIIDQWRDMQFDLEQAFD